MKAYYFTILICLLSISAFSGEQVIIKDYNASDYKFVGYKKNKLVYYCKSISDNDYSHSLWEAKVNSDGIVSFLLVEKIEKEKGKVIYIQEDIVVYYSFVGEGVYEFSINKENIELIKFRSKLTSFSFTYNEEYNILYFTIKKLKEPQLAYLDLNKKPYEIKELPIFGSHPVINDSYLYFSSTLISNSFSSLPYDLFRVRINNWNTTELIYENIENENWIVSANGIVFLHAYIKGYRDKDVALNVPLMKYDFINTLKSKNVVNINKNIFIEQKVLKENSNNKIYKYNKIDINDLDFKNDVVKTDIRRKIFLNINISDKPFTNTFITEELLYNSNNVELSELNKEELRILRNAFYARQGYQFNSKDLQDFYSQFDWYHKMVERNKYLEISNEEVVISPKDKERIELILEIENSK